MAIQSSHSPSSSTSQPTSTSTPTSMSANNDNKSFSPQSTIPFSFLIAFIALFLFFLGCGIGTRRAAIIIRRNFGLMDENLLEEDGLVIGRRRRRREKERPVIWDTWPDVDEKTKHIVWDRMQPLSATYVRQHQVTDEGGDATGGIAAVADANISPTVAPPTISPPQDAANTTSNTTPTRSAPGDHLVGFYPSRFGRIGAGRVMVPPVPSSTRQQPQPHQPEQTRGRRPRPPRLSRAAAPPHELRPRQTILLRVTNFLNRFAFTADLMAELGITPRHQRMRQMRQGRMRAHSGVAFGFWDVGAGAAMEEFKEDEDGNEGGGGKGPVEGLQVSVLVAMPSLERSQRRKEELKEKGIDSDSEESGESSSRSHHHHPHSARENLRDPPPEIEAEFGELVIGTCRLPWGAGEGKGLVMADEGQQYQHQHQQGASGTAVASAPTPTAAGGGSGGGEGTVIAASVAPHTWF